MTMSHKRGGSYTLKIMNDITNWSGVLLDRKILNQKQKINELKIKKTIKKVTKKLEKIKKQLL